MDVREKAFELYKNKFKWLEKADFIGLKYKF